MKCVLLVCRVLLGNNLFVFLHPREAEALRKKGRKLCDITYDFAMGEIGRNAGLDTANGGIEKFTLLAHELNFSWSLPPDLHT